MSNSRRTSVYYVCFLQLVACAVFLNGFFPYKPPLGVFSTTEDLPSSVGKNRLNGKQLYRRHYSKVVVMVIDAFRLDFITGSDRMPFLKELLEDGQSCMVSAKAEVPTVTLPRIKAIVTGTVPGFLDVIFNFGSSIMKDDNIIYQASKHGYNMVFYGDDTWLRLFPKAFKRFEGTSSFFVNDFYQVDINVTRNLNEELQRSDWDLMILHYLGLDHIGHVEGPYGPSVTAKLEEMDSIVRKIYHYFNKLKEANGGEGLLVLTGDHGMKNSGGHGGSSYEEVTVPVVFINSNCSSEFGDQAIQQGDLAPILSALLGIPIPAGSSGIINPKRLVGLNPSESLYVVYYNALRMKNFLLSSASREVEDDFNNGVFHYSSWIEENHSHNWNQAAQSFIRVQEKIAASIERSNKTNILSLVSSITLLFQALVLLFTEQSNYSDAWTSTKLIACVVGLFCIASWLTNFSGLAVILLVLFNLRILMKSNLLTGIFYRADRFFCSLIILHPLSYLSTSFVEEEHFYWYFTFATLLAYTMFKDKNNRKSLLPLLFLQRLLRNLNQTGDKWANLPDLGDWFSLPENKLYITYFYFIGLVFGMFANWKCSWQNDTIITSEVILIIAQGVTTYLYNTAIGRVSVFYDYDKSSGLWEVQCFWILTAIRTFMAVIQFRRVKTYTTNVPTSIRILSIMIQLHLSVIGLLMKPHNVIIGPSMVLFSYVLGSKVKEQWQLEVLHYWMGMCFFFLMGNSNNIASIDVTVGFIGLEQFNILWAGLFIILHTYAFPILAYLLLTKELLNRKNMKGSSSLDGYATTHLLLNGLPLLVFMILIIVQREHLFIWTVFSPKLLYLMCQTVLIVVLTLIRGLFFSAMTESSNS
uniref:GPI ethanolamine phosphate transferase 2 n=2 Tax=Lygus hesperus TaxID=30085 RepID=A0A0A9XX54_LYGHE